MEYQEQAQALTWPEQQSATACGTSVKRCGSANSPGAVIESIDHRSIGEFSSGGPVMASLNGVCSRRAHE